MKTWTLAAAAFLLFGCPDDEAGPSADVTADVEGDTTPPDVAIDVETADASDSGDGDAETTGPTCRPSLIPGPCDPAFDAALAAKARRFDRAFHAFNAVVGGVNADVTVDLDRADDRAAIEAFVTDHDGWDFEAWAGRPALDALSGVGKATGLYAGAGIAADAYRYIVLKEEGAGADELAVARGHLEADLEILHMVTAITGDGGSVARSVARRGVPGAGQVETVPMFDGDGNPLPETKNNGTWRDDNSVDGAYPDWIWEDSISRDMMLGWATAYAAVWEAIGDDPAFDAAARARMRADAVRIGEQLMVVRDSGYDLEIHDPDGRRTLHGCIHEHNFDCAFYYDELRNGFHAIMALGIVASWVYVSDDPVLRAYLVDDLLGERGLGDMMLDDDALGVDVDLETNFSGINMTFGGAWLALRYLDVAGARAKVAQGVDERIYHRPEVERWPPQEQQQALYDLVEVAATSGDTAFAAPTAAPDAAALASAMTSLGGFADAPYWNEALLNCPDAVCDCDDKAVDSSDCTAIDGTTQLTVLGCVGRNCTLVSDEPVPMAIRGPSNYHWRSHPYQPNRDGDGRTLLPGVDFRLAYWIGRVSRRPE